MDFPPELIFVLVAGLIGFINWLVQRSRDFRKASQEQQHRREKEGTFADEEEAAPPRPRIELPADHPLRGFESRGDPRFPAELALPRQPRRPPRLVVGEPPSAAVEPPPAPRRVEPAKPSGMRARRRTVSTLAARRRQLGPLGWREAVILREILGPPRSRARRRF